MTAALAGQRLSAKRIPYKPTKSNAARTMLTRRWKQNLRRQDSYILVLDNPRTAVYNKVKERRYPCKRLAPHQSSITKVMTATGLGVLGGHFFLCFFLLLP